mmetsp:Transcript_15167/g.47989  ORF Transcript_15167/g.47989 Transcript_15167/m.47989 type:complete len:156 (+) Transcript_15167:270-737(+)
MATFAMPKSDRGRQILKGFSINWMNMRDGETGRLLWEERSWPENWNSEEVIANIPKETLKCREVSRELNFSSLEPIENFRLEQKVFLHGVCIEEWNFKFGFVIPGSTNGWQSTIEAAEEANMLNPDDVSGEVVIETTFLDGDDLINRSLVRIYYV